MSDPRIVRPRLSFEEQFGQHRNWWVRDQRLAGNPISVLLFLLSHHPAKMPTQTESQKLLGLGKDAWQSAKRTLIECGFILEVRDRFPASFVDRTGRHRGGQRRFRLFLQDPEPDFSVRVVDAVLELDEPYEEYLAAAEGPVCGKSAVVSKTPDQVNCGKSAVADSPCADNPHTAENPQSFKEEKTTVGLVGSRENSNQPTNRTNRARESEIDAELAALHPDLQVTLEQVRVEVAGRVDLAAVDVVQAVRDTVLAAAAKGQRIENPARYAAAVIVRSPGKWPVGAAKSVPFAPMADVVPEPEFGPVQCAAGNHFWGSEAWPEKDRAYCVRCGEARRNHDPVFAELEEQLASFGGDR